MLSHYCVKLWFATWWPDRLFSGCDNYYNGEVMPCLMRPWLPPFSYSTTEGNNGEYKRKRRAARTWRAI